MNKAVENAVKGKSKTINFQMIFLIIGVIHVNLQVFAPIMDAEVFAWFTMGIIVLNSTGQMWLRAKTNTALSDK
jgi:hypothetical protein